MESYRFYLLSQQNRIGAAVYQDARNDEDALIKAPATFAISADFPVIEVWQGTRIVGRIREQT